MRLHLVRACVVFVVAGMAGAGAAERLRPDELGDARFERGGASVGGLHVALRAMGRRTLDGVDTDAPARRVGDEVRFDRAPGVVEWWRDTGAGLEEGVTIAERPVGDGELVLEVVAGEGVVPRGAGDTI